MPRGGASPSSNSNHFRPNSASWASRAAQRRPPPPVSRPCGKDPVRRQRHPRRSSEPRPQSRILSEAPTGLGDQEPCDSELQHARPAAPRARAGRGPNKQQQAILKHRIARLWQAWKTRQPKPRLGQRAAAIGACTHAHMQTASGSESFFEDLSVKFMSSGRTPSAVSKRYCRGISPRLSTYQPQAPW
jgi:hypothetical protein